MHALVFLLSSCFCSLSESSSCCECRGLPECQGAFPAATKRPSHGFHTCRKRSTPKAAKWNCQWTMKSRLGRRAQANKTSRKQIKKYMDDCKPSFHGCTVCLCACVHLICTCMRLATPSKLRPEQEMLQRFPRKRPTTLFPSCRRKGLQRSETHHGLNMTTWLNDFLPLFSSQSITARESL